MPIVLTMLAHVIQLENHWTDFDEMWYGCYTLRGHPKLTLLTFLWSVILAWQVYELTWWQQHVTAPDIGSYSDI
jgi:hypothetical protein